MMQAIRIINQYLHHAIFSSKRLQNSEKKNRNFTPLSFRCKVCSHTKWRFCSIWAKMLSKKNFWQRISSGVFWRRDQMKRIETICMIFSAPTKIPIAPKKTQLRYKVAFKRLKSTNLMTKYQFQTNSVRKNICLIGQRFDHRSQI